MEKSIGNLIRENRKKRKLTQSQLARSVGVARGTIVGWETNKVLPVRKTKELEEALNLPPGSLYIIIQYTQKPEEE